MKGLPIHICSIEYWDKLVRLVVLLVVELLATQEVVEVAV